MKKLISVLSLLMLSTVPALADVNTICQGGGNQGNSYVIELVHWDSRVGSKAEKAVMNGVSTVAIFEGEKGDILSFTLEGVAHVFGLDYNFMDATARLTGQGLDVQLFCSRY